MPGALLGGGVAEEEREVFYFGLLVAVSLSLIWAAFWIKSKKAQHPSIQPSSILPKQVENNSRIERTDRGGSVVMLVVMLVVRMLLMLLLDAGSSNNQSPAPSSPTSGPPDDAILPPTYHYASRSDSIFQYPSSVQGRPGPFPPSSGIYRRSIMGDAFCRVVG